MFLVLGALALAATSASSSTRHPTPLKGSVQGLFTADDYPAEALDRNEQGAVGFLLNIDGTGAVTKCSIQTSSGSDLLDQRTCEVIRERARFQPARDRRGRGVASTFTQRVVWHIEEDLPPSEPWVSRAILSLSTDGRPVSCHFEYEGAMATPENSSQTCSIKGVNPDAPMLRSLPHGAELVDENRFEIGTGSGTPELNPGDVLIQRAVLDLKIDEVGKLQSCTVITETAPPDTPDPCMAVKKAYQPRKGPEGQDAAFDATMTVIEFAHVAKASKQ